MITMEIDWDVHRMIENERRGFDDPPLIALRRLLKIDVDEDVELSPDGLPWSEDGVVVPHGSEAEMEYQYGRQKFAGKFLNGYLVVGEKRYTTLSQAASDLATTKDGKKTSLNGWNYWRVKLPGKKSFQSLGVMRQKSKAK